jgi:hypothetical protein
VYSDGVNGAGNSTLPRERFAHVQQPFVTAFVSRGAGEKLLVAVNGEPQPVSQPGGVGPDSGAAGFTVGSREDIPPGQQVWGGDIAEIIVFDRALSADEQNAIGSSLSAKYGLKTKYPVTPQSSSAPSVAAGASDRDIIIDFYFAALCRAPSDEELATALAHIASVGERRQGLEDVCWALLNSKEFLFQH